MQILNLKKNSNHNQNNIFICRAAKEYPAGWVPLNLYYGQLGLSYNNGSTPIWDDGISLESFFQIYNKTSQFTIKDKYVCMSLNGDTWRGKNTNTTTCNVRCQIRLSKTQIVIHL